MVLFHNPPSFRTVDQMVEFAKSVAGSSVDAITAKYASPLPALMEVIR
jgi:hypothetical protein